MEYNTADFIELLAGRDISGQCDFGDGFFFVGSNGCRPLLYLTF